MLQGGVVCKRNRASVCRAETFTTLASLATKEKLPSHTPCLTTSRAASGPGLHLEHQGQVSKSKSGNGLERRSDLESEKEGLIRKTGKKGSEEALG